MRAKLDIKTIQAINLFERVTRIKASYCFSYNDKLIFLIPYSDMKRIKLDHIRFLNSKFNSRIKVIPSPCEKNYSEIYRFVQALVPYPFRGLILKDKELIFSVPTTRAKAVFFGKDKYRIKQLADILKKFFDIEKVSVR